MHVSVSRTVRGSPHGPLFLPCITALHPLSSHSTPILPPTTPVGPHFFSSPIAVPSILLCLCSSLLDLNIILFYRGTKPFISLLLRNYFFLITSTDASILVRIVVATIHRDTNYLHYCFLVHHSKNQCKQPSQVEPSAYRCRDAQHHRQLAVLTHSFSNCMLNYSYL